MRLGREQLEKPPARPGGFFESFRLVQNVRPSIKYFGNLPWESFEGLDKSSPQNKRSDDRNVVDLEYSTGEQGHRIEA